MNIPRGNILDEPVRRDEQKSNIRGFCGLDSVYARADMIVWKNQEDKQGVRYIFPQ